MPSESSPEIEAKLIICSEDPLTVVASISALAALAGYLLVPQDSVSIHDYYVDTPDRRLKASECSLRVREINTSPWLTLKGPHRLLPYGLMEQPETEVPWSGDSLTRISGELERYGVRLPLMLPEDPATPPMEVLSLMGLEQVQHRENQRQIRNVRLEDTRQANGPVRPVSVEGRGSTSSPRTDWLFSSLVLPAYGGHASPGDGSASGPTLAELSIDSVVYHLEDRQIRHYEVEVEAKSEDGIAVLPVMVQGLMDAYTATLQKWDYGKLSIGRAIETLLAQGALEGLVNEHDQLLPVAYSRVYHLLERSRT